MTTYNHATVAVLTPCDICGAHSGVSRVFQDGEKCRMRTRRYVDYLRPLNRGFRCSSCGCTYGTKTVMEPKVRDKPEIRQNIVTGIRRLKASGWTLFDGDTRWTT